MLVGMLYSGPYYIITLYGLLVPGCEWIPDLTLVHSGALAQVRIAGYSYLLAGAQAFVVQDPAHPHGGFHPFWLINPQFGLTLDRALLCPRP